MNQAYHLDLTTPVPKRCLCKLLQALPHLPMAILGKSLGKCRLRIGLSINRRFRDYRSLTLKTDVFSDSRG